MRLHAQGTKMMWWRWQPMWKTIILNWSKSVFCSRFTTHKVSDLRLTVCYDDLLSCSNFIVFSTSTNLQIRQHILHASYVSEKCTEWTLLQAELYGARQWHRRGGRDCRKWHSKRQHFVIFTILAFFSGAGNQLDRNGRCGQCRRCHLLWIAGQTARAVRKPATVGCRRLGRIFNYRRRFGRSYVRIQVFQRLFCDLFPDGRRTVARHAGLQLSRGMCRIFDWMAQSHISLIRLQFKPNGLSSSLIKDVGKLFKSIRIVVFFIWCVAIGLCTALVWNFLFWHLENLAEAQ